MTKKNNIKEDKKKTSNIYSINITWVINIKHLAFA